MHIFKDLTVWNRLIVRRATLSITTTQLLIIALEQLN